MANRADYKRDPQADVWDMLARLKETVDKLAADVEEMRLREFVDQVAREDIAALTTRVAALESAASGYETAAHAASTYLTIANAASTYLTQSNAASTYETQSHAASTYETQSHAASTYLTITDAASTYETQSHASSTYETQSHAASTYTTQTNYNNLAGIVGGHATDITNLYGAISSHATAYNGHTHTETGGTTSGPSTSM